MTAFARSTKKKKKKNNAIICLVSCPRSLPCIMLANFVNCLEQCDAWFTDFAAENTAAVGQCVVSVFLPAVYVEYPMPQLSCLLVYSL